jgi:formate dehydrogenase subunit delta
MNSRERLVHMANQIAQNVLHEPDPAATVAQHIKLFWDPRMKRDIQAADVQGLSPIAAAAIAQLSQHG